MVGGPGVTVALWEQWDLVLISHWHNQGGGLVLLQYTTDWQLFTLDYDHSHYLWRHTSNVPQVRHVTVSRLLRLIVRKQCVVVRKELQDVQGFFCESDTLIAVCLVVVFPSWWRLLTWILGTTMSWASIPMVCWWQEPSPISALMLPASDNYFLASPATCSCCHFGSEPHSLETTSCLQVPLNSTPLLTTILVLYSTEVFILQHSITSN